MLATKTEAAFKLLQYAGEEFSVPGYIREDLVWLRS